MKRKKRYRRGYPLVLLISFEEDHAVLWKVFSRVVKLYLTLKLCGKRTEKRDLYTFHESVVDALRPVLKEGVRSIVAVAPMKTTYAPDFLNHIRKHHMYLLKSKSVNRVTFAELVGSADQPNKVAELVKTREFREIIAETTSREADQIVKVLEKNLQGIDSNSFVLYSLKEIEDMIDNREKDYDLKTGYLMLTDKFLVDIKNKNRIYRLLQISHNKKVKTRVVNAETPAGKRISQFGGIILFTTLIN